MPSWDPLDQRHWLQALKRQDWVRAIRADGREHLLTVARLVALHASWDTLESRPTWARLLARSGLSERTVARWLQELRVRGWLAHLEHGSTPAHRPTVLAHLSGNRAAVYGLRIPLSPEEALRHAAEQLAARLVEDLADQAATPDTAEQRQPETIADINGSPTGFGSPEQSSWVGGFSRASESVDNPGITPTDPEGQHQQRTALRAASSDSRSGPDWEITVPTSGFAMLIAANWLRRRLPVFASCSRKLVRHLCRPYWRAGWCNRDIVHAMDHRPGLFSQATGVPVTCPEHIAAPKAFIRSRLTAWRTPEDVILPGYWTSRVATAAATKTARRLVTARHGHAGAALIRPGETTLTAQRIAEHGRTARPPRQPCHPRRRQSHPRLMLTEVPAS